MRNIYLYGHLAEKFGSHFELDVSTAGEALRALQANFRTFAVALKEGCYEIVRGKYDETGFGLDYDDVNTFNLGKGDLHIVPIVAGSKEGRRGGFLKILIGIVLIGAAIFLSGGALAAPLGAGLLGGITWGNIALVGVSLILAGVSKLMTSNDSEDKQESYTLSGPGNNYAQGSPVPLVYGECIAGAVTVSAGLDIEDIEVITASKGSAWGG